MPILLSALSATGAGLVVERSAGAAAHVVTSYSFDPGREFRVRHHGVLLGGLQIPDGIALTSDRRWIAISNHSDGTVRIYENGPGLDRKSAPVGILGGIGSPHGIRFCRDDTRLVVADAGTPYLRVFESDDADWAVTKEPDRSVRVMDDATFRLGSVGPGEGGPKGIAIDRDEQVLIVTSEHQVLAGFDLQEILAQRVRGLA